MTLIEKFENMPFQDVGTFNSIFKASPILGRKSDEEVVIGPLTKDNKRIVKVSGEELHLNLILKEKKHEIKPEKPVRNKLETVKPLQKKTLSDIYKLGPHGFLIYNAIKDFQAIDSVADLANAINLSEKTIMTHLKILINLKLVKKKKVFDGNRTIYRIELRKE